MPDPDKLNRRGSNNLEDSEIKELKAEIQELKASVLALLDGFKELENKTNKFYMKEGTYNGIKFE